MKIRSASEARDLSPAPSSLHLVPAAPAAHVDADDGATLSGPARVVAELRRAAADSGPYGTIREDHVARLRKEIADGTFGGPKDVDHAIDALLEEL